MRRKNNDISDILSTLEDQLLDAVERQARDSIIEDFGSLIVTDDWSDKGLAKCLSGLEKRFKGNKNNIATVIAYLFAHLVKKKRIKMFVQTETETIAILAYSGEVGEITFGGKTGPEVCFKIQYR